MEDETIEALAPETEEYGLEYDEEGNVIIPDEESEADDFEESAEESAVSEVISDEESKEEIPEALAENNENNELRAELERLKRQYGELKAQTKDTLSKLGENSEDVMQGLIRLAAEASDKTPEEYAAEMSESRKLEEAKKMLENAEFERVKKEDLAMLRKSYPELREVADIQRESWFPRFAQLRYNGCTPEEAYSAANAANIRKNVAASVKRQNLNDTKAHLRSNASKSGKSGVPGIDRDMMNLLRATHPEKSDKQLIELYKRVT